MRVKTLKVRKRMFLGIINLAIFIVIMIVGLWPFNFRPENRVKWLPLEGGVRFFGQGLVYTPQPIANPFINKESTLVMEIQPENDDLSYIAHVFSFFEGNGPETLFIGQWRSHLILRKMVTDAGGRSIRREIGLRDALSRGKRRIIIVTSREEGTTISIDGKESKFYPRLNFLKLNDATGGQFVLGNSPGGTSHWTGDISFLAIYRQALTQEQASQHSYPGARQNLPLPPVERKVTSLYLFAERNGEWIYDRVGQRHLLIPATFAALQKTALVPPWDDFRLTRSYLTDILTNILGFIPLGFFLSAYHGIRKTHPINRLFFLSVLPAVLISLSIELVQVYLPTRSSQLMDVICNTLGAGIGAIAFFYSAKRQVLTNEGPKDQG